MDGVFVVEQSCRVECGRSGCFTPPERLGCVVSDELDAPPACEERAPADSFDPEIQWTWTGPDGFQNSAVIPLVANLTDDNADGYIDLCDTPDLVVVANSDLRDARLFVLDGATGAVHFTSPEPVSTVSSPALGDIDGDGIVEIVCADADRNVMALEQSGHVPRNERSRGRHDSSS